MQSSYLLVLALLACISVVTLKSISLVIGPKLQDCLFLEKTLEDKMIVDIQVISGHKINVRLISPTKESMQYHRGIESLSFNFLTKQAGEYSYCFLNSYSYTDSVIVKFDYDLHETTMNEKSKFKKQIEQEKKDFIRKKMKQYQPKVAAGVNARSPVLPLEDEEVDNSTLAAVQDGLLLLSLHLDRIEHAVKRKTARMTLSHYIQLENKHFVQLFSTILCFLIVFVSFGQVVFLKGFFNGKRSWKFWQF